MSDQKPTATMTAEDFGAAMSAFALSFANAIRETEGGSVNDLLEVLAEELRDLGGAMNDPEGNPTPAKDAVLITAAMLEASAPEPK